MFRSEVTLFSEDDLGDDDDVDDDDDDVEDVDDIGGRDAPQATRCNTPETSAEALAFSLPRAETDVLVLASSSIKSGRKCPRLLDSTSTDNSDAQGDAPGDVPPLDKTLNKDSEGNFSKKARMTDEELTRSAFYLKTKSEHTGHNAIVGKMTQGLVAEVTPAALTQDASTRVSSQTGTYERLGTLK